MVYIVKLLRCQPYTEAGVGRGHCLRVAGARAFEDLTRRGELDELDSFDLAVTVTRESGRVGHRLRDRRETSPTSLSPYPISINQHPDYERAKNVCPKCHGTSTSQHNTAAREFEVLLKCTDCGEIFDLKRAAETEIARRETGGAS